MWFIGSRDYPNEMAASSHDVIHHTPLTPASVVVQQGNSVVVEQGF